LGADLAPFCANIGKQNAARVNNKVNFFIYL